MKKVIAFIILILIILFAVLNQLTFEERNRFGLATAATWRAVIPVIPLPLPFS